MTRLVALLLALCMLSGCSIKWEETTIEQDGFAAAFPMPVKANVHQDKSREWWAWAGDTETKVIVISLGSGGAAALGGADAVFAQREADLKSSGTERSPMRRTRLGAHPAFDYHMAAKFGDGTTRELKGRNVLVNDTLYIVSASWPVGYKTGPESAERLISSFRPLK